MASVLGHSKYKVISLSNEELSNYMGIWYEIAVSNFVTSSKSFESGCMGSVACYTNLIDDKKWEMIESEMKQQGSSPSNIAKTKKKTLWSFDVNNYCLASDKLWKCNIGYGQKINPKVARLVVVFDEQIQDSGFIGFLKSIGGDYLIIDFKADKPETSYSVVFGGLDKYFWILSRNPKFSETDVFAQLSKKYSKELKNCTIRNSDIYSQFTDFPFESHCYEHMKSNPDKKKFELYVK